MRNVGSERKKESDLTSLFQARLAYWTAIALSALLLPPPKHVPKGTLKSQPNAIVAGTEIRTPDL